MVGGAWYVRTVGVGACCEVQHPVHTPLLLHVTRRAPVVFVVFVVVVVVVMFVAVDVMMSVVVVVLGW